MYNYIYMLNH